MPSLHGKRRRRIDALLRRREIFSIGDDASMEPSLEERHELDALVRDDEDLRARVRALDGPRDAYIARWGAGGVRRFRSSNGILVFMFPVETFPGYVNNLYLLADASQRILVDAGSGTAASARELRTGLSLISKVFDLDVSVETLDLVVITHAHIDHSGGVGDIKQNSRAQIAIHELDARVIRSFYERRVLAANDIDVFLRRAGVEDDHRKRLGKLYMHDGHRFQSVDADWMLRDGDTIANGVRVHHVPGHCPGLICLQVGDIMLTSDHVLARITPHQSPQSIAAYSGLEHYFRSLAKVRDIAGIEMALGGHEAPITNVRTRIDEIVAFHRERLDRVMATCQKPQTIAGIASALFGPQEGYGTLLAFLEAGAHVEYLHAMGQLCVANVDEIASRGDSVVRYEARRR